MNWDMASNGSSSEAGVTATRGKSRLKQSKSPQERIRIVAQRLFAQHGFEGVSLKMITDKARVNIAAVNYYFGSKDELFISLVRHHMTETLHRRVECLQALEKVERETGKSPALEVLLDAWISPALDVFYASEDGPGGVRMAMQLYAVVGPEGVTSELRPYADYFDRMHRLVGRRVPHLRPEEVVWRFECMSGLLFYTLAQPNWQQRVPAAYCSIEDRALMRQRLLESALALFR
jgi:AcrR family transcriptional regulator